MTKPVKDFSWKCFITLDLDGKTTKAQRLRQA
jgi:hypothetical protein